MLPQHPQFSFGGGKPRKAAIQANGNLRECQQAGISNVFETAQMHHYLSSKFRLIANVSLLASCVREGDRQRLGELPASNARNLHAPESLAYFREGARPEKQVCELPVPGLFSR